MTDRLEELRQRVSDVWGKQPCWPNEETCVLHVIVPTLLKLLDAETKRCEAAEAVIESALIEDGAVQLAIWRQAKTEAEKEDK